jgi:EAL domain-containing protein (putative c-di-GMP-specific phosphodiesterase class I)
MYESLMRISDKDGKIYYPDEFLPVAKEYDLYESLSELMVETVFDMFRDLDVRITINLNVQDIYNRKMIQIIFDNLQTASCPENYVFEIVESEEITDYKYIREFADRIHQLGAKVAIDDFGSGFSNLLHVLKIAPDYIKIDGEIIRTITEDSHCLEFIQMINDWCAGNNQEVIAEYVENKEIQDIIDDIGVCHSQGYFFSKPHRWGEAN